MSWRDDPATLSQKIAIRKALDKRYRVGLASEMYEELDPDHMTKGQASDELKRLYEMK